MQLYKNFAYIFVLRLIETKSNKTLENNQSVDDQDLTNKSHLQLIQLPSKVNNNPSAESHKNIFYSPCGILLENFCKTIQNIFLSTKIQILSF
jgi:hypothetical protein